MATNKAVRADDVSGLNIATETVSEDAVTKHIQRVVVNDPTTAGNKLAIDSSGRPTVNVNGTVVTTTTALIKDSGATELFTATNPGRVDPTGTTVQPVSGTFWQVTQPVSLASVPSHAVTNAGTFAVQAAEADGANVTLGSKADAKSTATDTTAVTAMQVLKQISASVQAPPSQAVTNAGTFAVQAGLPATVDTNSGVKSASTLRVVLATDQPALTNKLLVTPDSVALPANQSVNMSQVAGTTTDTNSGVKSAGTLRVVLATDQPALTNKLLVTPDSVALPANQSVNVSQINAVTPLMGNGVTGTGSQRVTIASDNTAFTVNAQTVPTTTGGLSIFSAANSGTKAAVKASAGQIYGWQILNTTAAIAYVQLWNVASASVTVGTTAPDLVLGLPASGGATFSSDVGIAFGTAITVATTTTRAGSTGAACEVAIFYK